MKYLIILISSLLIVSACYGGVTYTKVDSSTAEKAETTENITRENITLQDLKDRKARLIEDKLIYNSQIDSAISGIDKDILSLEKLGITDVQIDEVPDL